MVVDGAVEGAVVAGLAVAIRVVVKTAFAARSARLRAVPATVMVLARSSKSRNVVVEVEAGAQAGAEAEVVAALVPSSVAAAREGHTPQTGHGKGSSIPTNVSFTHYPRR